MCSTHYLGYIIILPQRLILEYFTCSSDLEFHRFTVHIGFTILLTVLSLMLVTVYYVDRKKVHSLFDTYTRLVDVVFVLDF